ncbi:hypothetical protein F5887DRAFT_918090 [Amanita rubescens]|nr:hypothetical protein F5887DRAFT_918090 [Amanita rubescens]
MSQDAVGGMSNIDWRLVVESSLDYESPTRLNWGGSTTDFHPKATLTASVPHPYSRNPQPDEESIFCALASGNVALDQLGQLIINVDNPGNPFPSAGTDETLLSNMTKPYELPTSNTGMHIFLMSQHIGISAGRQASNRRRMRAAEHRCDICDRDFTAAHNLRCCTF